VIALAHAATITWRARERAPIGDERCAARSIAGGMDWLAASDVYPGAPI
jgi:hypothetical protein